MDEKRYEAMMQRMAALSARVAVLEKKLSAADGNEGVRQLRIKHSLHMTKTEAAQELGVTRATIYAMIADGRLETNATGKVTTDSLVRLITGEAKREPGQQDE